MPLIVEVRRAGSTAKEVGVAMTSCDQKYFWYVSAEPKSM